MHRNHTHRLRYQLTALIGVVGFCIVASWVVAGLTLGIDESVLRAVHRLDDAWLTGLVERLTVLGDPASQITVGVLVGGLLLWQRKVYRAFIMALLLSGSGLLVSLLKVIFDRARPELWARPAYEASFSFPSGHAAASLMIAIVILYALPVSRWKLWLGVLLAAYVAAIGFTRLYLGVHYPSDVLAGWFVSLAWAGSVLALTSVGRRRS